MLDSTYLVLNLYKKSTDILEALFKRYIFPRKNRKKQNKQKNKNKNQYIKDK